MNLVAVADAISWTALLLSLTAATVLSVLAFLRPRAAFIWYAAATLGIALMAAASISAPAEFGLAPLVTVLGFAAAVFGGSPAAAKALDLAMGSVAPGLHGGIVVTERPSAEERRQGVVTGARREVLRGGLTIGVLERVATAGTIIAGIPRGPRHRRGRQGRRAVHRARGPRGARAVHHRHVREPDLGVRGCARRAPRRALTPVVRRRPSARGAGTARRPDPPGSRTATGTPLPRRRR